MVKNRLMVAPLARSLAFVILACGGVLIGRALLPAAAAMANAAPSR